MCMRIQSFKIGWQNLNSPVVENNDPYHSLRPWQEKFFLSLKDSINRIINAPTGSGKSRLMCALAHTDLAKYPNKKCIIAVPQSVIAKGVLDVKLNISGENIDFCPLENLCDPNVNASVKKMIKFLETSIRNGDINSRICVCTHATLALVYNQLKSEGKLNLFNDCFLWCDEAHHVKNVDVENVEDMISSNVLGEIVRYFLTNSRVNLVTATPFRGDRFSLLTPEMESKFTKLELPYDEYFKSMRYLKSFNYDFIVWRENNVKLFEKLFEEGRNTKDIIYYQHRNSNKYEKVEETLEAFLNVHGGEREDYTDTTVISDYRIVNLVCEKNRVSKKKYLNNPKTRNTVKVILSVGMVKEGYDDPSLSRIIIIGPRGSLTEVTQLVGRLLRDHPGKEHVEVVHVMPYAFDQNNEEEFRNDLNNYLKAILCSMILENVMVPRMLRIQENQNNDPGAEREYVQQINWFNELVDSTTQQTVLENIVKEVVGVLGGNPNISNDDLRTQFDDIVSEILDSERVTEHVDEIRDHIWNMLSRQTLKMEGINVEDIDLELLKKVNPLGFLLRFTSSIGVDTFKRLREKIGYDSLPERKQKLIDMAINGEPRPSQKTKEGQDLNSFTNKATSLYDHEFYVRIHNVGNHWYAKNDTTAELLALAKSGAERPQRGTRLGNAHKNKVSKASSAYDPDYIKELKNIPSCNWLKNQRDIRSDLMKKQILQKLEKDGFIEKAHKLWHNYRYFINPQNPNLNNNFIDKVNSLKKKTFKEIKHSMQKENNQKEILEHLELKGYIPITHPKYVIYNRYINQTDLDRYDSEFAQKTEQYRDSRNRQLENDSTSKANKSKILNIYRSGSKLTVKDPLYGLYSNYRSPASDTYDSEFRAEIDFLIKENKNAKKH